MRRYIQLRHNLRTGIVVLQKYGTGYLGWAGVAIECAARWLGGSPGRLVGLEHQRNVADSDDAVFVKLGWLIDLLVVEKRPVATIEIFDVVRSVLVDNLRMATANRAIVDMDLTIWMSTDNDRRFGKCEFLFQDRFIGRRENCHAETQINKEVP